MTRPTHDSPHALVLFAHGSRDPLWRAPFDAIALSLQAQHKGPVALAFLELMTPTLADVMNQLHDQGVRRFTVLPLFLAAGKHLRHDLPALLAQWQASHLGCQVTLAGAMGEAPSIQTAAVNWAISHLNIPPN